MKKILLLLSMATLLFASSCKKDQSKASDIANSPSSNNLIEKNKVNHIYTDTTKHLTNVKANHYATNNATNGSSFSDINIATTITYNGEFGYYNVSYEPDSHKGDVISAYIQRTDVTGALRDYFSDGYFTHEFFVHAPGNYRVFVTFNGNYTVQSDYFTIYPTPVIPSGMVGLFRYTNPKTGKHFTTNDWQELASTSQGYKYENLTGYASSTNIAGTVPLYRFYSDALGNHFYTTTQATPANYVPEGIVGYIGSAPFANLTTQLLDYYSNINGGDHVVAYQDEIIVAPYVKEGIMGYVQQPPINVPYPKDGDFISNTNTGQVFLFFEGQLRYIPNTATLNGLFVFNTNMLKKYTTYQLNTLNISTGDPINISNGLINDTATGRVYLREVSTLRWIQSSDVFNLYHFNSNAITNSNGVANYTVGNPITN